MTAKQLAKACAPFKEELNRLQQKELKLEAVKDAKIPAHEKIDKNSSMYKHLMALFAIEDIEATAIRQKHEDRAMLKEIGGSINTRKVATDNSK